MFIPYCAALSKSKYWIITSIICNWYCC